VRPIVTTDPVNFDDMLSSVQKTATEAIGAKPGDRIIISAGVPFGEPGTTNTLKIDTIK